MVMCYLFQYRMIKKIISKLRFFFKRTIQEYKFEEEIREITGLNLRASSTKTKTPIILKKLLFIIKNFFTTCMRRLFPFEKYQMESSNSFLSLIIGAIWIPFRRFILLIVSLFDSISTNPYGVKVVVTSRKLFFGSLSLKVKARQEGIDYRSQIWKKDVLRMIIKYLKDDGLPSSINFLEIGAASGLVSLFLAEWSSNNKKNYDISCIEPSLKNVQFLEETAVSNKLRINIIPMALSSKNGWVDFCIEETRGVVGSGIDGIDIIKTNKVPSMNFETLKAYISDVNICYVDAFANETQIVSKLLLHFPNIKMYIIEFNSDIPINLKKDLEDYSYKLSYQSGINYQFTKSN